MDLTDTGEFRLLGVEREILGRSLPRRIPFPAVEGRRRRRPLAGHSHDASIEADEADRTPEKRIRFLSPGLE